MGKNGKFGKDYGNVVGANAGKQVNAPNRPGWKGPGFVKKVEPRKKAVEEEKSTPMPGPVIPLELQQLLLNIFKDTFPDILQADGLQQTLQDVKSALYERDFARAFGTENYLEAYSVRWSPSRSLCYASVLLGLRKHLAEIFPLCGYAGATTRATTAATAESALRIVAVGGGPAEVVALGGFLRYLHDAALLDSEGEPVEPLPEVQASVELVLLDTASWQTVVEKLQTGIVHAPPLSKYASAAAKAANKPLVASEMLVTSFRKADALELSQTDFGELIGPEPLLITLLFTLNELYAASISKTTKFLLDLTLKLAPGSVLLVVDSPGSYSETSVGLEGKAEAKKYPMKYLLDHTLLHTEETPGHEARPEWEKIYSEDSQWFRLDEKLKYSIPLENMRYQVHLYRRT